jgi:hypothetical protein
MNILPYITKRENRTNGVIITIVKKTTHFFSGNVVQQLNCIPTKEESYTQITSINSQQEFNIPIIK